MAFTEVEVRKVKFRSDLLVSDISDLYPGRNKITIEYPSPDITDAVEEEAESSGGESEIEDAHASADEGATSESDAGNSADSDDSAEAAPPAAKSKSGSKPPKPSPKKLKGVKKKEKPVAKSK